jgi:hypothetical protein
VKNQPFGSNVNHKKDLPLVNAEVHVLTLRVLQIYPSKKYQVAISEKEGDVMVGFWDWIEKKKKNLDSEIMDGFLFGWLGSTHFVFLMAIFSV